MIEEARCWGDRLAVGAWSSCAIYVQFHPLAPPLRGVRGGLQPVPGWAKPRKRVGWRPRRRQSPASMQIPRPAWADSQPGTSHGPGGLAGRGRLVVAAAPGPVLAGTWLAP